MKRKTKNIIMVSILLIMSVAIYFTLDNMTQNTSSNQMQPVMEENIQSSNGFEGNEPPEMPEGESQQGQNEGTTPPEMPEGDNSNSEGTSQMPGNENNAPAINQQSRDVSIIYDILLVIENAIAGGVIIYMIMSHANKKNVKETFINLDKAIIFALSLIIITECLTIGEIKGADTLSGKTEQSQRIQSSNVNYSAVLKITEDTTLENETYTSSLADENAILVNGEIEAKLSDIEITKSGDSDGGDNTSFYGYNSGLLACNGANITLENITVNSDATGGNGVFCYGGNLSNDTSDETTITISNSSITTTKDNSGGIMATGGGIINADNLTINTAGTSSAAIRSDRGGGQINVNNGSYTTTGKGSPAIYSTAEIVVENATLEAKVSEGIVIEGKNSVEISKCTLVDSNTELNGQSTTYKNIFLYQSMSGDADEGTSSFKATDSTITTNHGDTFYITNTEAVITLENNTFIQNDENGYFLRAQKDSWGNSGSNGGSVTMICSNQVVEGDIYIDSISSLNLTLQEGSSYTGIINGENTAKSLSLKIDKDSKISLTGDWYLSSFDNEDETNSNIDFNGFKIYVNGEAIN